MIGTAAQSPQVRSALKYAARKRFFHSCESPDELFIALKSTAFACYVALITRQLNAPSAIVFQKTLGSVFLWQIVLPIPKLILGDNCAYALNEGKLFRVEAIAEANSIGHHGRRKNMRLQF